MKALAVLASSVCLAIALAVVGTALAAGGGQGGGGGNSTDNYPDLRTVVPAHLNLVNEHQRDLLRFSNGIANTGDGPWAMRPENELGATPTTTAWQEIRSSNDQYKCGTEPKQVKSCYTVLDQKAVSIFEYHPTHNHWHTADVALFEVRKGGPTGQIVGSNSIKLGFCLLDLYRLDGNAPTSEKTFWDCYTSYQGVSVGWVDQYHQATDGQEVELTDVPNGDNYYLVSTTNPTGAFLEQDETNNTAWVRFTLSNDANGNRKVTVTGTSPCDSPGLCGERATNR